MSPPLLFSLLPAAQLPPLTHGTTLSEGLDSPARLAVTGNEVLVADTRANTNLSPVAPAVLNQTLAVGKAAVFTTRDGPNSFEDGDPAENDGICQVCHTATNYHTHDGTGSSHHDGENCLNCHAHDAGFMPTGGDCTSCHNSPQDNGDGVPVGGRRAVVGEFPVDNTHAHYGAELDSGACATCHDMATHGRLRRPDRSRRRCPLHLPGGGRSALRRSRPVGLLRYPTRTIRPRRGKRVTTTSALHATAAASGRMIRDCRPALRGRASCFGGSIRATIRSSVGIRTIDREFLGQLVF